MSGGIGTVILLFIGGLALVLTEVFMPGIVIGLIGTAMLVTSIYLAFTAHGALLGFALIGVCVVVVPLAIGWGLRRLAHRQTMPVEQGFVSSGVDLSAFLGARGEATSPLRPSGKGRFAGQKLDVTTEGQFIPSGSPIEVIEVKGSYLVVRPAARLDSASGGV